MKRLVLSLAVLFTLSSAFVSCRDTKKENIEVNVDDVNDEIEDAIDDTGDAIEDAVDESEDVINEGVNEIKENTGTGGTDDNK
ncbi:hypothetical protein SCB49_08128 [unidentified eubacterium SCB49]|nr:hypothetical protein SCB49_08128 [unidentified eubacterium SCB49]